MVPKIKWWKISTVHPQFWINDPMLIICVEDDVAYSGIRMYEYWLDKLNRKIETTADVEDLLRTNPPKPSYTRQN